MWNSALFEMLIIYINSKDALNQIDLLRIHQYYATPKWFYYYDYNFNSLVKILIYIDGPNKKPYIYIHKMYDINNT